MKLSAGLDVSLAETAICVISQHGKIQKEAEVAIEPEALVRWLDGPDGSIGVIGPEATLLSLWPNRGLTEAVLDTFIMETH